MKKKLSLLFLVLGLVLFFSCTDDDSQVEKVQGSKVSSFIVSPDSAIAISNQAIQAIAEQNETRNSSGREVNSVSLISLSPSIRTRAANEKSINTSLYFINYKDNKGFSIVSSDKRLRPLYAVSDTGNIAISDTITNKGLALFFQGVEKDMQDAAQDTLELSECGTKQEVFSPQVRPMIWRGPRLWGQDEPYNTYCYTEDGKKALVGCVAVACGIIMSHYEWPRSINEKNIGWHAMKKYTFDHDIDFIFRKLGNPELLDMHYGVYASGAKTANAPRAFEKMGYYRPNSLKTFSEKEICNWLKNRFQEGHGPVLVRGGNVDRNSGHAWVVDGYCTNIVNGEKFGVLYNSILFHCIWGWNGTNNGYFYLNNGRLGGPVQILAPGDNGKESSNRYSDLQYIANFRKNTKCQNVTLK